MATSSTSPTLDQLTGTAFVSGSNTTPVVSAGADATINERGTFSQAGSFTDPGADSWTATVNYGEVGGLDEALTLSGKTFTLNHLYSTVGIYTVTVRVTETDVVEAASGSDTVLVTVARDYQRAGRHGSSRHLTVAAGATATFSAAATGYPAPLVQWQRSTDGSKKWKDIPHQVSETYNFTAELTKNGYQYRVVFTNSASTATSNAATLTVTKTSTNTVPVVNAGADASITVGSTFSRSGSFTDPDLDTWTGTVNYGDGSGDQTLALSADRSFTLSHPYATEGSYTVTVSVSDGYATGTGTLLVTVSTAPADGADLVLTVTEAPDLIKVGDEVTYTITVTTRGRRRPRTWW